jgi:hypothetical protein
MNYLPPCIPSLEFQCGSNVLAIENPTISLTPRSCPANVSSLAELLVRDLPSYTNRVIQRRRKISDKLYSSILAVGKPDLTPIAIVSREYPSQFPQAAPAQLFISSLERQYTGIKSTDLQQFHWLFLAKTNLGWRLVNIYTRTSTGTRTNESLITPPIESSKSSIAEAVRLWLNDCYFGNILARSEEWVVDMELTGG